MPSCVCVCKLVPPKKTAQNLLKTAPVQYLHGMIASAPKKCQKLLLGKSGALRFKVSPANEREGGVGAIGRETWLIFLGEIAAKSSLFWGQNWRKTLLRLQKGRLGFKREAERGNYRLEAHFRAAGWKLPLTLTLMQNFFTMSGGWARSE